MKIDIEHYVMVGTAMATLFGVGWKFAVELATIKKAQSEKIVELEKSYATIKTEIEHLKEYNNKEFEFLKKTNESRKEDMTKFQDLINLNMKELGASIKDISTILTRITTKLEE